MRNTDKNIRFNVYYTYFRLPNVKKRTRILKSLYSIKQNKTLFINFFKDIKIVLTIITTNMLRIFVSLAVSEICLF